MDEHKDEKITIHEIAYHRNGIAGEPFAVVTFTSRLDGAPQEMIAVLFPNDISGELKFNNPRTAVFDREKLGQGIIAFFENSYRGDVFDVYLRPEVVKQGYLEQ